jgi:uncharacterized protein (TIGR00730 family)
MTGLASVTVFCGSRNGAKPAYQEAARDLGRAMAGRGIRLVYGGGGIGLMDQVAEAVMAGGGRVIGVIPDFLMRHEVGKKNITENVVVPSMHDRKRRMFELSDGFVVLPGGIGTLEEAVEIITWKQLQLHTKPVVLFDVDGYWRPFLALIDHVVAEGFAHGKIVELFSVADRVEGVLAALESASNPGPEVLTSHF